MVGLIRYAPICIVVIVVRGVAWCCVVLRGVAWCCVVLRGVVWCILWVYTVGTWGGAQRRAAATSLNRLESTFAVNSPGI